MLGLIFTNTIRLNVVHSPEDSNNDSLSDASNYSGASMQQSPVTSEDGTAEAGFINHARRRGFIASRHNSKLRELLYPTMSESLPKNLDMGLWLMCIGPLGPTKRAMKTVEFLIKFIAREGTKKPMSEFLDAARLELKNDGWPSGQQDEVSVIYSIHSFPAIYRHQLKLAWSTFYATFGFNNHSRFYESFDAMVETLFPPVKHIPDLTFTLMDLQTCGITIKPTQNMYEHLALQGDVVRVLALSKGETELLQSLSKNVVAQ